MKRVGKWLAITVVVLCIIGFAISYKVYSDLKGAAEKMYTPLTEEDISKRPQEVNITSKEPFSALLGVDEREGDAGRSDTMVVLTINPTLETTKMLSIPRNTYTEIIGKPLLFQIISGCYERKNLILTTNLEFSKWTAIFYDEKKTAELVDRLVHHSHLIAFQGPSYWFQNSSINL